jgi:hypothetical protein
MSSVKIFETADLLTILAERLGVSVEHCQLVNYCPIRGPHGPCYGVAVKVAQ